jgi:single-strand DNA-binding protein
MYMSQSYNKVILIGRLTDVPVMSSVGENNISKARFKLAVNNERSRDAQADFIVMEAFGKTAELMGGTLGKGSLIAVDGQMHTSKYESNNTFNREGNPAMVYATSITVDTFTYLEKKGEYSGEQESDGLENAPNTGPVQQAKPAFVQPPAKPVSAAAAFKNKPTAANKSDSVPWPNKNTRFASGK